MADGKLSIHQRAAEALDREARSVSERWALRIRSDVYSDRPDLTPQKLEASAVPLVRGLAEALRRGQPTKLKAPWTKAAREHAVERRDQHILIGDLQREYQVMRQEVWATLERELAGVSVEDVYDLARSLDAALDTMATISTDTYAGQLQAALEDASRLASVVESSVDAILYVSPEGIITNWNRGAEEIHGYSADEVVGKPLAMLTPPERSREFEKLLSRLRHGEEIRFLETERVRKDGRRAIIALTAAPIRSAEGEIAGFSWVAHDITERKRLEEERERLLERERAAREEVERRVTELETVVESTDAQLALLDRNFNFVMVNSAYAQASGYRKDELIGRNHFALFPNPENEAIFKRVRDTGQPYRAVEKPFEFADQLWRGVTYWNWILVPIKDETGMVEGLLLSLVDVTPQVRARQRIQELAAMADRRALELDATISAISDGLIIYGPKGEIVHMNKPAERMLGLTEEELRKLPFAERVRREGMLTEEGQPIPIDEIPACRALRGEVVAGYRFMIRRPDGTALHLLSTTAPIRDAQGHITGAVANFADVTQLVELIRLRDEVTSTVAHDIRQPLTIIQGQAQVAQRSLAMDRVEPAKRSIDAIITSAQRMNVMIEDLVDSVRLEAGRLELKRKPIDLEGFLADLLQRSSASMDVGRVRLTVEKDMPKVSADPDRLERIVLNLVSNALKYSEPETPVDLRVKRKDETALVAVQDRGVGIGPEDLPHIFDRYYKPKGPSKKESIGLGLYITKILVEAHGGRIWVESRPGRGSIFSFTLPLRKGSRPGRS